MEMLWLIGHHSWSADIGKKIACSENPKSTDQKSRSRDVITRTTYFSLHAECAHLSGTCQWQHEFSCPQHCATLPGFHGVTVKMAKEAVLRLVFTENLHNARRHISVPYIQQYSHRHHIWHSAEALFNTFCGMFQSWGIQRDKIKNLMKQILVLAVFPVNR